jgi:polyisoprenoid-binding protein YceI
MPDPPVRLVDGVSLPAVGTWLIDPDRAYVGFRGRHLGLAPIRGRFTSVSGRLEIAEIPSESSVEVEIAMASVVSGSRRHDAWLHSLEHFDARRRPIATFRSTRTRWNGRRAQVEGPLTIIGATNTIELSVEYRGTVVDPEGAPRATFLAAGPLDRSDWGLTWRLTLDGGGILVGRRVRLEIELEAVRHHAPGTGPVD